MAFVMGVAGDKYHLGWNEKTKVPKSGYTAAVGDLVILDASIANGVDLIAANENPYGIVDSVNNSSGLLTVCELVPGTSITLPYSGSVALGDKVEGDGSAGTHNATLDRSPVRADDVNGVGFVIAVDADTAYGTGFCTVRFS